MTAPADVSEVQSAATERSNDDLVHIPRCGDGDTALCGKDLTGHGWCDLGSWCVVCQELDDGCVCEDDCSCCNPPSLVIFDEVHYFTGGAA